jgi:hypothetical protein
MRVVFGRMVTRRDSDVRVVRTLNETGLDLLSEGTGARASYPVLLEWGGSLFAVRGSVEHDKIRMLLEIFLPAISSFRISL